MSNRTLRIHHLSDVHISLNSNPAMHVDPRIAGDCDPETRHQKYIEYLEDCCSGGETPPPDFVIISGDLTKGGTSAELDRAREFLKSIENCLRSSEHNLDAQKRIVVVPGNHDYAWSRITNEKQREEIRVELSKAFDGYVSPYMSMGTGPAKPRQRAALDWCQVEGMDYPIAFVCIDSCDLAGNVNRPAMTKVTDALKSIKDSVLNMVESGSLSEKTPGEVNEICDGAIEQAKRDLNYLRVDPGQVHVAELKRIIKEFKQDNRWKSAFRIAILHHPIFPVTCQDRPLNSLLLNSGQVIPEFETAGFHLTLCGHIHTHRAGRLHQFGRRGPEPSINQITAGTLGGSGGKSRVFHMIEVDRLANDHNPDGSADWHCKASTIDVVEDGPDPNQKEITAQLFVGDSDWRSHGLHLLHMKRLTSSVGDDPNAICKRIDTLIRSAINPSLGSSEVEEFREGLSHVHRIHAVDVQAFDAWLDPLVFYYFCAQLPRYIASSLKVREDGDRWNLSLSPEVYDALKRAEDYAKKDTRCKNLGRVFSPRDESVSFFQADDASKVFELVRILLWDPADLISKEGEAFRKMHEVLRIPLFYLNPKEDKLPNTESYISRPDDLPVDVGELFKESDRFEYIYCLSQEDSHKGEEAVNDGAIGLWVDMHDDPPKDERIRGLQYNLGGNINPRDHFRLLLRHTKLRLADDAAEIYAADRRSKR
ncbi:metallophosphoesterase [Planctomycetales bacterium ZRK34]|nr:metallophosphoesterase [Planctomycetales bacterium ZRK34]